MTSERLHDLIQADLDGALSAADRAELARALLQDPEARRLHGQMQRTDRLLREVPAAEPPARLRDSILAGTARRAAAPGRWRRLSTYRVAAAFVGGLLVVGAAYFLGDGRAPGSGLQGSLAAPQQHVSLLAEGMSVDAALRRDGGRMRLELEASATAPGEVVVRFDAAATTFTGSAGEASVAAAPGSVTVPLATGSHVTALEFSAAAPIRLELHAGGQLAGAASLAVTAP